MVKEESHRFDYSATIDNWCYENKLKNSIVQSEVSSKLLSDTMKKLTVFSQKLHAMKITEIPNQQVLLQHLDHQESYEWSVKYEVSLNNKR